MPVIVRFDPLATLVAAFEALWPEKACELAIAPYAEDDEACARLGVPDEPGDPLIVLVNARSSIDEAVEALATVLAPLRRTPWLPPAVERSRPITRRFEPSSSGAPSRVAPSSYTDAGRWTRVEASWVVEQRVGWCAMSRGGEPWRGLLLI